MNGLQSTTIGQSRPLFFYVPVDFDLDCLPATLRDYAAFLLNLVQWKYLQWKADGQGYVRLKRAYLQKVIPRSWMSNLRSHLMDHGVLEVHASYRPGCRSFGYRIAAGYRRTRRMVCHNSALARRVQRANQSHYPRSLAVHEWLDCQLHCVRIDIESANRLIGCMQPEDGSPLTTEEYRLLLSEQCERIANGDHWLVMDKYGRVHTPITSLARELRRCLRVRNEPLVGIDLANSQPLMAGIAACLYFRHRTAAQRMRDRKFDGHRPSYMRIAKPRLDEVARPDVLEYLRLCEEGQLYDSLTDELGSRDKVKVAMFREIFFGSKKRPSRLKSRFYSQYPSIGEMLSGLKDDDYRHSAHMLQNIEATIFIGRICERIRRERPDLVVFTIHDSLLTVPSEIGYVRRVVLQEFDRLGVHPTLTLEQYA